MKMLGECLVFQLKYPQEMKKIMDGEELEGLEEPERTRKMVDAVGLQSRSQAADFLEECGTFIADHFSRIGNKKVAAAGRIEKRPQVESKWTISYGVWPAEKYKPPGGNWRMKVGVSLEQTEPNRYEVIPWIWRDGGEKSEEFLVFQLKEKAKATSKDLAWEEGYVALARVPLSTETIDGFDLDCEKILEAVRTAVQGISENELKFLYPK